MKPTLKQIVKGLAEENGLEIPTTRLRSSSKNATAMNKVMAWVKKHPDEVEEIIEEVISSSSYGDPFYEYFNDEDKFDELIEMHETEPDRFYDIVKSYELFLNVCAKKAGYDSMTIRINIDDLLDK